MPNFIFTQKHRQKKAHASIDRNRRAIKAAAQIEKRTKDGYFEYPDFDLITGFINNNSRYYRELYKNQ